MTDLIKIPGIGKKMAQHLINTGYPDIESLQGQDPEEIYAKHCSVQWVGICHADVFYTATAWRCITPTMTGSSRLTNRTGRIGRIDGTSPGRYYEEDNP